MTKRGKILRDTTNGPGLLIIDGQQHGFTLEDIWKSATPPSVGLVVDADFDETGKLVSLTAVTETELAKQELARIADKTQEKAKMAYSSLQATIPALIGKLIKGIGKTTLIAWAVLVVGWLYPTAFSFGRPWQNITERVYLSFWQLVQRFNADSRLLDGMYSSYEEFGIYSVIAIVVLCIPLLQHLSKSSRAYLGGFVPLAFMIIVYIVVTGIFLAGIRERLHEAYRPEFIHWKAYWFIFPRIVHFEPGALVSFAAALFFAIRSTITHLAVRAKQ